MRLTGLTLPILLGALLLQVVPAEKPGVCPECLNPCSENLKMDCDSDGHCNGTQKCCQDGCVYSCKDPAEMTQELCPEYRMPWRACFIKRLLTKCWNDACCNWRQKCCMYKCDRLYKGPAVIKKGECPLSPTPYPSCRMTNMKNGNCTRDQHCYGTQKCCYYNCQNMCKDPAVTKPGKCAKPQVPLSACFAWKPQGGCRSDLECDGAKKCCLYDCQYVCREPVV